MKYHKFNNFLTFFNISTKLTVLLTGAVEYGDCTSVEWVRPPQMSDPDIPLNCIWCEDSSFEATKNLGYTETHSNPYYLYPLLTNKPFYYLLYMEPFNCTNK